jgi:hypothetical protein
VYSHDELPKTNKTDLLHNPSTVKNEHASQIKTIILEEYTIGSAQCAIDIVQKWDLYMSQPPIPA